MKLIKKYTLKEFSKLLNISPDYLAKCWKHKFLPGNLNLSKEVLHSILTHKGNEYLIKSLIENGIKAISKEDKEKEKLEDDKLDQEIFKDIPTLKPEDIELSDLDELRGEKIKREIIKIEEQTRMNRLQLRRLRGQLVDRVEVSKIISSYLNLLNHEILDIGPAAGDEIFALVKSSKDALEGRNKVANFLNDKMSDLIKVVQKKIDRAF